MDPESYVHVSRRETKCRCCKEWIEPGRVHFCFWSWHGTWRNAIRICELCLGKILREVKT